MNPGVLVHNRLMAGSFLGGSGRPVDLSPIVNIGVRFSEVYRDALTVVKLRFTILRSSGSFGPCSVSWSVTGEGSFPITGTYFNPSSLPSGSVIFDPADESEKEIEIEFSAGPLAPAVLPSNRT